MKSKPIFHNLVYLDFEFNSVSEEKVNLVSCVTMNGSEIKKWWLYKDKKAQSELRKYLEQFTTFVSYAAVAECRSFYSLGMDPRDFEWIDLFFEYRCLTNHNDKLKYGKQLVNGKVKETRKPISKYNRTESDQETSFKPTHSLAEATYKLLGAIRDTEHKEKMRDLIINNKGLFIESEIKDILNYGVDDVKDLPKLLDEMILKYKSLVMDLKVEELYNEMLVRGNYAAHTAIMESKGYPIDLESTRNFSKNTLSILVDCQKDINDQFKKLKPFKWDNKTSRYTWDQKKTRAWIAENYKDKGWTMTDGGKSGIKDYSLSLEAFERFFDYDHEYPRGNFGAQMVRFLKLKQSLYGFVPAVESKKKTFWDYVGSDGRVRPYMNPYMAQSSRSQPAATGFIHLKPAFMRVLVQPSKGKAMAGVDYGSQEFFVAALLSEDKNMIDSYLSGDVYVAFGKLAGMIPENGTKETHKAERNICKSLVLGISYLMGSEALARKLTIDSGIQFTKDQANAMIDKFYEAYPKLDEMQDIVENQYRHEKYWKLECLATGTEIITKLGNKKIEDISSKDILWDGEKWVSCGGTLYRGQKDVMRVGNTEIFATPDHLFLIKNTWVTTEELKGKNLNALILEKNSEAGKLYQEKEKSGVRGMSCAAACAVLKNIIELDGSTLGKLLLVFDALNLIGPEEGQNKEETAKFFLTKVLELNGGPLTITQKEGVKIKNPPNLNTTAGGESSLNLRIMSLFSDILSLLKDSIDGTVPSIELIMTPDIGLETCDLLPKQKITEIKKERVFDIAMSGENKRFSLSNGIISHNCGWYMFGDNDNARSVNNVPIQGLSACIMRKAVDLAAKRGLYVCFTLHDALYIEYDVGEEHQIVTLMEVMKEATAYYFENEEIKKLALQIKLDPFAWSPDYEKDSEIVVKDVKIPCSNQYIDERAISEYNKFKKYFSQDESDLL